MSFWSCQFNQSINTGNTQIILKLNHWCGLRPSVLGQDRSETKKFGLGLVHCGVGLVGLHGVVLWNAIDLVTRRHNQSINQWRWQTQAPKCLEIYVRIILSTLYYIRIQPNNYTYILRSVSSSGKISWRTQQLFKYYLLFLYSVLGTSLLWRSTVAFTYLKAGLQEYLWMYPRCKRTCIYLFGSTVAGICDSSLGPLPCKRHQ